MVFEVVFSIALIVVLFYPILELVIQYRNLLLQNNTVVDKDQNYFFETKAGFKSCDEFLFSLQKSYVNYQRNLNKTAHDILAERDFNLNQLVQTVSYSATELGFGTTSVITSFKVHDNNLIISLNSASSSDPDIASVKISELEKDPESATWKKLDTGPGVAEISISNNAIFAADTSTTDTIQKFVDDGTSLQLVSKFVIPKLSDSYNPIAKSIEYFDRYVLIGLEKNIGPEIYIFDSETGRISAQIETGYGITRMRVRGDRLFVLGPSDPEIDIFQINVATIDNFVSISKIGSYDAQGFSGNGRSLDFISDYMIFGRSRGNEEFNLLRIFENRFKMSSSIINPILLKSLKVSASIDSIIAASQSVFQITSDQTKEFQLVSYFPRDGLSLPYKSGYVDLPSRANDFICIGNSVYIGLTDPAYAITQIKTINGE